MKLAIINGPNLNLLKEREPKIYGDQTFEQYFKQLVSKFSNHTLSVFQSNVEGEIINMLQSLSQTQDGIILNAGGYTHTSVSISDCIAAINTPVVEVHISNVMNREKIRHISLLSKHCKGVIGGFGLNSYLLAIQSFLQHHK